MFPRTSILPFFAAFILLVSCNSDSGKPDSGMDSGTDAGFDGGNEEDGGANTDADTDTDQDGSTGNDAAVDSGDTDTSSITNGDGTCTSLQDLTAGPTLLGSTVYADNDLFDYSCTALNTSGRDLAFRYVSSHGEPVRVNAHMSPAPGLDLDLFALLDDCAEDSCSAYSAGTGDEHLSFIVSSGQTVFFVVDGRPSQAGQFSISVQEEPVEQNCTNGMDDDGDGPADCADEDCAYGSSCVQSCVADITVGCGYQGNSTTASAGDDMQIYSPHVFNASGEDLVVQVQHGTVGAKVQVTLTNPATGQFLVHMSDGCDSDHVSALGIAPVTITSPLSTPQFFAVDGPAGTGGSFELSVECEELLCDDGADNDGDGLDDCADPDCATVSPCAQQCDLLSADAGCPDLPDAGAQACYLSASIPSGYCHPAGFGSHLDPCSGAADCHAGLICPPAGICLYPCDLADSIPSCPSGTCTSMGANPLGVCW